MGGARDVYDAYRRLRWFGGLFPRSSCTRRGASVVVERQRPRRGRSTISGRRLLSERPTCARSTPLIGRSSTGGLKAQIQPPRRRRASSSRDGGNLTRCLVAGGFSRVAVSALPRLARSRPFRPPQILRRESIARSCSGAGSRIPAMRRPLLSGIYAGTREISWARVSTLHEGARYFGWQGLILAPRIARRQARHPAYAVGSTSSGKSSRSGGGMQMFPTPSPRRSAGCSCDRVAARNATTARPL